MADIYLFNSGHEQEVLYDSLSYTLPERSTRISLDFELIPLWYAQESDYVLIHELIYNTFYEGLISKGFVIPQIIIPSKLYLLKLANQVFKIVPWGLSSAVVSRIHKNIQFENDFIHVPKYNHSLLRINSRLFAIDILSQIKEQNLLSSAIDIPQVFDDFDTLSKYIDEHKQEKLLVKSPYSSAGIGLLWIRDGLEQSETQILKGFFKRQKCVVVEKVYTKVLDFALEYKYENDSFEFKGISLFTTNNKGAYQGNILRSQQDIVETISQYVDKSILEGIKKLYVKLLNQHCKNLELSCIGIDMMIIATDEGYQLHPCVEVNPRYNMGYLAVAFFEKHVVATSSGFFKVLYADPDTLTSFVEEHQKEYPISMVGNKLQKGFLAMNPVLPATKYLLYAILEEERKLDDQIG